MIYNKVLLPIDLQEMTHVSEQLDWAAQTATTKSMELRLISVLPGYGMSIVASHFPSDMRQKAISEANELLMTLAEKHLKDCRYTVVVREGRPHEQIIEEAQEQGSELIAISHNSRSHLGERIFGSVAQRVSERAPCSVLIIRQ